MMESLLSTFNYGLVLLFGVFLSVLFAGGTKSRRERLFVVTFVIFTLVLQTSCSIALGLSLVTKLYPLITHLPLALFLVFALKKPVGISVVSVLTAYFCCQLPRWAGVLSERIFHTRIAYLIAYSLFAILFFLLIWHFFATAAYQAMSYSTQSLRLFGCLPLIYYLFDYASTVYTSALYTEIAMLSEFLPTAMVFFYIWFIVAYQGEVQQKTKIQMDNDMLTHQLKLVDIQMADEQKARELSRLYRHDMRHHFALLKGLISDGNTAEAISYIDAAGGDIEAITPVHYCLNNTVNLILSSFVAKGEKVGVTLKIEADLPQEIKIPETELCAILSNGLENAVREAAKLSASEKVITACISIHKSNLLLTIENPYDGQVRMKDGLPQSDAEGHGFGVRSIDMLTRKHGGYCSFSTKGGVFTLKVALPV